MLEIKKKYLIILIPILFLAFRSEAQQNPAVIKVNKMSISYDEFLRRLNELPIPHEDHETLGIVRQQLVCSLIGEAILAQEAEKENLNELPQVKAMSEEYHQEALYEQWMKSEVTSKIKITPEDIQKGYNRLKYNRDVEFWILPSLKKAKSFRKDFLKGISTDVKAQYKILHYSEAEQNIEDTVYSLRKGQISEPIRVDSLYYIFQLKGIIKDPEYAKHNVGYYRSIILERIRTKKDVHLAASKLAGLMKNVSFIIEHDPYNYLLSQLEPIIFNEKLTKVDKANIIQQELSSAKLNSSKMNDVPLIIFKDGREWTVKDVWEKLAISPYPINYKTPQELENNLPGVIKQIVLLETVAKYAEKKGFGKTNYVQYQTEMWTRNLLAEEKLDRKSESFDISNKNLFEFYDKHKNDFMEPEKRKVLQLVVSDKKSAEQLYKQIKSGEDFLKLAKKYSINKLYLDKNDPGIFITRGYFGDAGNAAFLLTPGQITKPEKVDDSTYAILKLLKVESADPKPFDQVHDELYAMYEGKLTREFVDSYLLKVVKNYKIKIDWNLINEIPYTGGDMAVRKTHFPLRNAVPYFPFFNYKSMWFSEAVNSSYNSSNKITEE